MDVKEKFAEQLRVNLKNNGFPQKKVSFPTEKLYEAADSKGCSLNSVLDILKEEGVQVDIGDEKIIFSFEMPKDPSNPFSNVNPDMLKKAQDMMSNMDPEELKRIQDMVANMSPDEQAEMMEKAKKMGMF